MNIKKIILTYSFIHVFFLGMFAYALSGNVMPLGDSITKGYITGDVPANEWGYRGSLWTQLKDGGSTVSFVGDYSSGENYTAIDSTFEANHSGINGETTAELLARTNNTTLTNNDPQVVLLHIGTNDINETLDINAAVTNVSDTLDEIYTYNSSIKVYLARILNLKTGANATKIANVTAYNNALETMANTHIANGDNLQIVNMETGAGIDYTADMAGDWHPTQHGYDLMANHWYAALNGEVHHWALDETSGTTLLDAMGSTDGTCTGNCPASSVGIKDGAQFFNGSNEVNVTETATFDIPGDASFTIELWVKTNYSSSLQVMIGRDDGTTTSLHWWIGLESTGEALFTLKDRDDAGAAYQVIKGTTAINDGEWHHIAAVRDGSTGDTILYVDGVNEDSENFTSTVGFAASTPVTIGYFVNDGSAVFHFNGSLDDIYVHNRTLSATEIQAHYNDSAIQITTVPVTFAELGVPYYYDVNTSKDPVDFFDWTLTQPASWMSINDIGEVTGTPDAVANLDVNITATKGTETATQNYVLKVRDRSLLSSDMAHYWKLDEGNGTMTYLDSYSAVDATCTGSNCPTSTTGQVANAQLFDGINDGLNVTDASTFDIPGDASFTIEFWIKSSSDTFQIAIGRDNPASTGLHWWVGIRETGKAQFYMVDSANQATSKILESTDVVNDGEWHHVAAVRDGSITTNNTSLYVDGQLTDTVSYDSTAGFADSSVVTIGYFILNGSPDLYLNGSLDEIAVYGSALTPTEVTEHYQNGLTGNELEVLGDTVAPVITITGDTSLDVEVDTVYTDEGATATDNLDGDLTGDIATTNPVDTSALGTYSVDYSVTDRAGNTAEANRTVNVVDTTAPVITLSGDANTTVEVGGTYSDAGASATDNVDGDLTGSIATVNPVDTNTVGTYTVTYDVNDSSGNAATQESRTVNVVDTTAPVITLTGDDPQTIEVGTAYSELGATAADNYDGNLTGSIVIDASAVDTNTVGTYTVTYDVNDSSGNAAAQESRTVNVVDTTAPVITLTGDDPQTIEVGTAYSELGATAADNYDGNLTGSIVIDASAVDTNAVGSYSVTYDVNDSSGNAAAQVSRTVNVVDTTIPEIILTGDDPQTIEVGTAYSELGATATDNVDGNLTVSIVIDASAVDTNTVGSYSVTYDVNDSSNNAAVQVSRTVNVVDTTAPVITLNGTNPTNVIVGESYIELATCSDNYDASCSVLIGGDTVDTSTVGNYTVTYDATDASGNIATQLSRIVNVTAGNAPVITLAGDNPYTIEVYSTYTDPGATATDIEDGDVSVTNDAATAINTAVLGDQTVTYMATDSQDNTAYATRTVKVVDTTAPVITLNGDAVVSMIVGSAYVDAGASSATDNVDGDLTGSIVTVNPVDTNTVGTYTVTYDVSDSSGNAAAQVTRTVNVIAAADTTAPVITLNGNVLVSVTVGSTYTDAGATAIDNVDGDLTGSIVTVNPVDTNTVGSYTVTYDVNDSSGNAAAQVTRTVNVVEASSNWYTESDDGTATTYTIANSTTQIIIANALGEFTIDDDTNTFTHECLYITIQGSGDILTGYNDGCDATPGDTVEQAFVVGTTVHVIDDNGQAVLVVDTPLNEDLTFGG